MNYMHTLHSRSLALIMTFSLAITSCLALIASGLVHILVVVISNVLLLIVLPSVNIVQIILVILFPLLGRKRFYQAHIFISALVARCFMLILERAGDADVEFSKDAMEIPDKENVLLICNHYSFSDFLLHIMFSRMHGRLFHCKYFAKESLKWIPFFGWGLKLADHILINRNWATDQSVIDKMFQRYIEYELPAWIVSFPEGGRNASEKRALCAAFCKQNNYPELKYVLFPRTKGFVASVQTLKDTHFTAIYDMTIAYQRKSDGQFGKAPPFIAIHAGLAYKYKMHVDVKRFEMKDLPKDEEGLSNWLIDRFYKKDEYLGQLSKKWKKDSNINIE